MPETRRATVVLPVPGLPTKTRCRVILGVLSPALARLASIWRTADCRWISPLTASSPISASSSASNSSSDFSGTGGLGVAGVAAAGGAACVAAGPAGPADPADPAGPDGTGAWTGGIPPPTSKRPGAQSGWSDPRSRAEPAVVSRTLPETSRSCVMTSVQSFETTSADSRRGCGAGAESAPSWAAAALVAFATTAADGCPKVVAAVQISPRARVYAAASACCRRTRSSAIGVAVERQRRPREAAAVNSAAPRSPPV